MESLSKKIEDVAKRRGFFWISSDLYGGISGLYDYGHVGTLMKRKFENLWRRHFLALNDNFFEIETSHILPEKALIASGHKEHFVDPLVRCTKCGNQERADHLLEERLNETFEGMTPKELSDLIKKHKITCPRCKGQFDDVGSLNMMFPIIVGSSTPAYLRPETAQGAYVNFKRLFEVLRKTFPLGVAIVGKAFRNEISPRNVLLRMREFTQAELQIFFDPETIAAHENFDSVKDYMLSLLPCNQRQSGKSVVISCSEAVQRLKLPKMYVYYMAQMQMFYTNVLGIGHTLVRFKELEEERAFYNKYHWDLELNLNTVGWKEVGGLHYRTDHDLSGHARVSQQDMAVFVGNKKLVPHVLELSFGVDRNVFALMDMFYTEDKERDVFSFPRLVAPYDCAVFPLVNKNGLPEKADEIKEKLVSLFTVFYDDAGSIGRRYRRMDEIGTPLSITVDAQTLTDNTVTFRDRDTMKQVRIRISDAVKKINEFRSGKAIDNL